MITLAGIPMICPPRVAPDATMFDCAWVERHIDPRVAVPWLYRAFPGKKLVRITWPTGFYPAARVELNRLHWYPGALRWSYCHLLCASTDLDTVRTAAYGSDGKGNSRITLRFEVEEQGADGIVQTDLYLLPPTPQMRVQRGAGEALADHDGAYLLTLVDERFGWQTVPMPPYAIGAGTTWEDLIGLCATAVGTTLVLDPIPAAYLKPHRLMQLQYEVVPPVLEACLVNCGLRLVRSLEGTYHAMNAVTSAARFAINAAVVRDREAGGERFRAEA